MNKEKTYGGLFTEEATQKKQARIDALDTYEAKLALYQAYHKYGWQVDRPERPEVVAEETPAVAELTEVVEAVADESNAEIAELRAKLAELEEDAE